jgi:ABC-type dipeptide/oligopeptide/nickel transport system permease component
MIRFIVIRILQSIVAFFGIMVLVFFLVRASGDPTVLLRSTTSTPEAIDLLRAKLGIDKSLGEQFWIYLTDYAQGDFGESYFQQRPVIDMVMDALPNTLKLGIPSFVIGILLALLLGVLAATRRDSIFDNGVKFIAILGQALPGFWVAIMAVLIFSVYWRILPAQGMDTPINYILPVGTMVFFMLPGMMRLVRSSMLDVLDSEYVKLARIKGLSEYKVIWKHALRNALIVPLTTAGMLFAGIVGGAVITENIFNWPGMGRLALSATMARDFPVVQTVAILVAIIVLGMNLLVDISYAYVDPQIRYTKS